MNARLVHIITVVKRRRRRTRCPFVVAGKWQIEFSALNRYLQLSSIGSESRVTKGVSLGYSAFKGVTSDP